MNNGRPGDIHDDQQKKESPALSSDQTKHDGDMITIPDEDGQPNCSICLNRVENRSYTNTCLHEFCHQCIVHWSEAHNQCPICRRVYTKIFFNIRGPHDYDEQQVNQPQNENGFLIVLGRIGVVRTPPSGLYLVNPIVTPQGVNLNTIFLGGNQTFLLYNANPRMILLRPEQMHEFEPLVEVIDRSNYQQDQLDARLTGNQVQNGQQINAQQQSRNHQRRHYIHIHPRHSPKYSRPY